MHSGKVSKWTCAAISALVWMSGCGSSSATTAAAGLDTVTADAGGDIAVADQLAADATQTDAATADIAGTDAAADAQADTFTPPTGGLVLNEIGAKGTAIGAWNPSASDWLELYNGSSAEIDLSGYVTVDKKTFDIAGKLPAGTKIAAKGFLIVWFNHNGVGVPVIDKGISTPGSASLFEPGGNLIDTTTWISGASPAGGSWARATDGGEPWKTFAAATPGKPNSP